MKPTNNAPAATSDPAFEQPTTTIHKLGLLAAASAQAKQTSARAAPAHLIKNLVAEVITEVSAQSQQDALQWSKSDMLQAIKRIGYTVKKKHTTDFLLSFLANACELCPSDTVKALTTWGQPHMKVIVAHLEQYANNREEFHRDQLPILWGKSFGAVFNKMKKVIWPNTHKKENVPQSLKKHRCIYGIRITQQLDSDIEDDSPISTPSGGSISKQPYTPRTTPTHRMTIDMTTPHMPTTQCLSFPTPNHKKRARTTSLRTVKKHKGFNFEPYYDILHNNHIYVVRVFLPLMKPETVQGIDTKVNMAYRQIVMTGSYFPSTLIGIESAKKASLQQPLLPVVYANKDKCGQFQLTITLPADIKDSEERIQMTHDCWGITITVPRRKICHDAEVQLTTCFGSAKVTSGPPQTSSTLQVPPRAPRNTHKEPEIDPTTPESPPPTVSKADPKSLLGKILTVPGEKWGAQWKGRTYKGTITHFHRSRKDKHIYFTAEFDDVTEQLWLDELLKAKHISQECYDLLEPICNHPPTKQNN